MINQVKKVKGKTEKPALKVMHTIDKNTDGSVSLSSNAPKLREAVGMGPKPAKTEKPKAAPKAEAKAKVEKNGIGDFDYKVLHALDALGGKDVDSMTLAKKTGTTHSHPDAPRAPIRSAMQAFEKMGYVKAEKKGAKYLFSITEQGKKAALTTEGKDKEAHKGEAPKVKGDDPLPKPSTGEQPANTDIECPKCHTFNPFGAEFCKECGSALRPFQTVPVAS